MSTGLIALLDDVAGIAKVAAASLDDVAAAAGRASAKAAGVVIDDAAVTPRYVVGFAAARELPIIGRIAWGSLRNKLLFLLPGALLLSFFVPGLKMPERHRVRPKPRVNPNVVVIKQRPCSIGVGSDTAQG